MPRVLVVEDNINLAANIAEFLEMHDIESDHATNGVAGLHLTLDNHYDCLILDLNLPKLDGLKVCKQLRCSGDDTPILMLTARDSLEDKLKGFDVGADDYLVKPFSLDELLARVKVLSGRRSGAAKALRCDNLVVSLNTITARRGDRELKLTPTTYKILVQLMRCSPNAVSKEQLSEAIWEGEMPETNSLKVHIYSLRKQLEHSGETKLLHTIPGHGFAIRAEK